MALGVIHGLLIWPQEDAVALGEKRVDHVVGVRPATLPTPDAKAVEVDARLLDGNPLRIVEQDLVGKFRHPGHFRVVNAAASPRLGSWRRAGEAFTRVWCCSLGV